jgi:hypothetical protein
MKQYRNITNTLLKQVRVDDGGYHLFNIYITRHDDVLSEFALDNYFRYERRRRIRDIIAERCGVSHKQAQNILYMVIDEVEKLMEDVVKEKV